MKQIKKTTMSFSITQSNKDIIATLSDRDGCSASDVVNKALETYALFDTQYQVFKEQAVAKLAKKQVRRESI